MPVGSAQSARHTVIQEGDGITTDAMPQIFGRGDAVGFAQRTEQNLSYMLAAFERGENVHVVTHVVTSLVGLIVFPFEYANQSGVGTECFEQPRLNELVQQGWPKWTISIGKSETLLDLLHHLRNAVAHRRIHFSSDSRQLNETDVTFHDRPGKNKPVNWQASIRADQLSEFVLRLARLLDSCIG